MQAAAAPAGMSRPLLLERSLLFTLACSLLGDYCGGNLPLTDAWAFFTLLSLYLAGPAHRPIVVAFCFGAVTLFSDIIFLAVVRLPARWPALPRRRGLFPSLYSPPPPTHTRAHNRTLHLKIKRDGAAAAFSALEYLGKAAATYLLYYYLRSDLGGVLTLAGEPTGAAGGAEYQYKDSSSAGPTFAAADGGASDAASSGAGATAPYSGGYNVPTGGGYNASPAKGGGYQSSL